MSEINALVELLRKRREEAQQRFQMAQQKFAIAQGELQAAQQELNSYAYAFSNETRKLQMEEIAVQAAKQAGPPAPSRTDTVNGTTEIASMPDIHMSKTALVRGVLQQNPNGIAPTDICKALKNQVASAYVYSVLKRMKDRDEVTKKRGKYSLKQTQVHPAEEATPQNGVVMIQH
jgi:hypothetical protein